MEALRGLTFVKSKYVLDNVDPNIEFTGNIETTYDDMVKILEDYTLSNVIFFSLDNRVLLDFSINDKSKDVIVYTGTGQFVGSGMVKVRKIKYRHPPKKIKGNDHDVNDVYKLFINKYSNTYFYVLYDKETKILGYKSDSINVSKYFDLKTLNNLNFQPINILITRDKLDGKDTTINTIINRYPTANIVILCLEVSTKVFMYYNKQVTVYTLDRNVL